MEKNENLKPEVDKQEELSKIDSVKTEKKGPDKKLFIIGGVVVLVVLLLIIFLPKLFMSDEKIVEKEVNEVFKALNKGLAKADKNTLKYDLEKDSLGIEGNLKIDSDYKDSDIDLSKLKNYKISYSGAIDKNKNKANVGLKLDGSKNIIDVNGLVDGKKVYVDLGDLFNKTLTTNIDTEIKDLELNNVDISDIKKVVNKTEKVVKENIDKKNITSEKVDKKINGKEGTYKKVSYKVDLNDQAKKVLTAYKDDEEILKILSEISNTKEKDMKKTLEDMIEDLKDSEKTEAIVDIYLEGKLSKTKALEVTLEGSSIFVEIDNNIYNYKLMEEKTTIATGTYDKSKKELTLKADNDGAKVNVVLTEEKSNKLSGEIKVEYQGYNLDADFELETKLTRNKEVVEFKLDVDFKSGAEKINFEVDSETTTTVGVKIKDVNKSNTIDVNGISDEDMMSIYTKFMEKIDPVAKDIVPNYDLSSILESLA